MDTVLRAVTIYLVILVLFRLTGKRAVAQITTMDLVLLLIISEAAQQSLVGDDYSVTNGILVITTLVLVDRCADWLKFRSHTASRLAEGVPLILVAHGRPLEQRLNREHLSVEDILAAARKNHGLLRLAEIDYAILEPSGGISIIPRTSPDDSDGEADPAGQDRAT